MTENKKENKITAIQKPFLTTEKGLINKKQEPVQELKEYIVLLMKNNGYSEFLEDQKAGEFLIKTADGNKEKSIILSPNKLTTFVYNKQFFKGWVIHEDNMSPYPEDPIHNAEIYRKTTQKLAINYKDANEAKFIEANTKKMIAYVAMGILAIVILSTLAKKFGWFTNTPPPTQTIQTTTQIIKQNLTNTGVTIG